MNNCNTACSKLPSVFYGRYFHAAAIYETNNLEHIFVGKRIFDIHVMTIY